MEWVAVLIIGGNAILLGMILYNQGRIDELKRRLDK